MKPFCGEISYMKENGPCHSDICFNCDCNNDDLEMTDDYRQFLHDCLDEWLNKSNGTGFFWLGKPENLVENFKESE